jgi:hypothetical protein
MGHFFPPILLENLKPIDDPARVLHGDVLERKK